MERTLLNYGRIIGLVASLALPSQAYALEVIDSTHIAETQKVLSEARKQLEEARKMYGKLMGIEQKLGNLGKGGMSIDAWLQRGEAAAQCVAPGLIDQLKLPNGATPQYIDLCQASQSIYQALMPQDQVETVNGKKVSRSEHIDGVRQRRNDVLTEASINGVATARSNRNSIRSGNLNAQSIITRSNQAETIDDLLRENNRALSLILGELVEQRNLMAGILENLAAANVKEIPMQTRVVPMSNLGGFQQ